MFFSCVAPNTKDLQLHIYAWEAGKPSEAIIRFIRDRNTLLSLETTSGGFLVNAYIDGQALHEQPHLEVNLQTLRKIEVRYRSQTRRLYLDFRDATGASRSHRLQSHMQSPSR